MTNKDIEKVKIYLQLNNLTSKCEILHREMVMKIVCFISVKSLNLKQPAFFSEIHLNI